MEMDLSLERFVVDGVPLASLRAINALPMTKKQKIYSTLLPKDVLTRYGVDLDGPRCDACVQLVCQEDTGSVEIAVYHPDQTRDPMLYLHLTDTPNHQLMVLLFVVNDPHAPRFDVDQDWQGEPTKLGTFKRNIEAETVAMQAGLMPGQVRRGLRLSRHLLANFETFVSRLGHQMFFLDPLTYNTAILFERYGCNYSQGLRQMEWIHREFAPGGELYNRLDGSTPFRQPGAHQTIHGRSWAIHDGILGYPFDDVKMYKRVGVHAGIDTFPGGAWR